MDALPFFFFIVATLYSLAGFAGGSSYAAVLTLFGAPQASIAPTALACNLVVSAIAAYHFQRAGHFRPKLVLPLLLASMPAAFVGAKIPVDRKTFLFLLAFCLAAASLRILIGRFDSEKTRVPKGRRYWAAALPGGAALGLLSGIAGIGGGIFLSPLLVLSRCASVKEASAAASVFIFANSLSGLWSRVGSGNISWAPDIPLLLMSCAIGGFLGSRLGAGLIPQVALRRVMATLLIYISFTMGQKAMGL